MCVDHDSSLVLRVCLLDCVGVSWTLSTRTHLAYWVMLAVRAEARDIIYLSVSSLAVRACLAVSVSRGPYKRFPRLASRVTLAVRADARYVISIYISVLSRPGVCSIACFDPGAGLQ